MDDENNHGNHGNLDDLISAKPLATKRCRYPNCEADLPADAQFEYCDKCRILAARNAAALIYDPCVPKDMERMIETHFRMLHNMTGDEMLNYLRRQEELYLHTQKIVKLENVVPSNKRTFKTMAESIAEARAIEEAAAGRKKRLQAKADKGKSQKATRLEKAKKLFTRPADMSESEYEDKIKSLIGSEDDFDL